MIEGLNKLANDIYLANKEKGFWVEDQNIGEKLMLIVTEVGEAMEAHRENKLTPKFAYTFNNPVKEGIVGEYHEGPIESVFKEYVKDSFEDELADTIIRLLDLCGARGIDIEWHIKNKLDYNKTRPHKHGKQY